MEEFKKNDFIVTLDKSNSNPFIKDASFDVERGGAGFIPNMCFKIKETWFSNTNNNVYFLYKHTNGIYANSIRAATLEEIQYYKKNHGPYNINEVTFSNVNVNYTRLITILKFIQNHEKFFFN
jgi:hypothetical protein